MTKGAIKLAIKAYDAQIEHCFDTIRELNKIKEEVQEKCPHDEGEKEQVFEWAPGHQYTKNVCNICGKIMPDNNASNNYQSFTITNND